MNKIFLALGLGILVFAACNSTPVLPTYKATANSANEKQAAPVVSDGVANVTATLDGTTLTLKIDYSKMSGTPVAAHIHGPADEASNADVVCDFSTKIVAGATAGSGTIDATCPLDAKLTLADLDAGKTYVNIHTAANGKGEVRGQLKKQ
jgi:CHRD domain